MKELKVFVLVPLWLASAHAQVNNAVRLVSLGGASAVLCPGGAAELDLNNVAPGAPHRHWRQECSDHVTPDLLRLPFRSYRPESDSFVQLSIRSGFSPFPAFWVEGLS
jgi:hypothetical protein